MHFLMEARFKILRSPLVSCPQNKSGGGLGFQFRAMVSPARKSRQNLKWQLDLEKRDFWIFFKRRHATQIKKNRIRITNLGSIRYESESFVKKMVGKIRLHRKTCNFFEDFHRARWVSLERYLNEDSKNVHVG